MSSDYPQHEKLKSLNGANNTVGDFIGWLQENGYQICRRTTRTEDTEWQDYVVALESRESFIARFFGIDADELSSEKDRMLEELRRLTR